MSNTSTQAMFVGGVEGLPNVGATSASIIAGVGTILSGAPVLGGGLNLVSAAASNTAFTLPTSWPLASPLTVVNTSATGAVVFPGSATQKINGASAGASYPVAANKAVTFWYLGVDAAGAANWAAVGA